MLKITNDGRKLALDQRLIDPMLPDFENSTSSFWENVFFGICSLFRLMMLLAASTMVVVER